jgi:hypothetical protein
MPFILRPAYLGTGPSREFAIPCRKTPRGYLISNAHPRIGRGAFATREEADAACDAIAARLAAISPAYRRGRVVVRETR